MISYGLMLFISDVSCNFLNSAFVKDKKVIIVTTSTKTRPIKCTVQKVIDNPLFTTSSNLSINNKKLTYY